MTSPILKAIASHLSGLPGETRRNNSGEVPAGLPRNPALELPRTLVLSGILHPELNEVVAAFVPSGFVEQDRRHMGDWSALLLRRPR
jgi:hypothetical protein